MRQPMFNIIAVSADRAAFDIVVADRQSANEHAP